MRKLIFLLIIMNIFSKPRDVEIVEDFSLDIEYALEKSNGKWKKRGVITFKQKGSNKNYRSLASVVNNEMSHEDYSLLVQECEKQGKYIIRLKTIKNYLISSIPACDLIKNDLKDKISLNYINTVKLEHLSSINYEITTSFNEKKTVRSNSKTINTQVDFVETRQSLPPLFPDERDEVKPGAPEQQQQSFFSKYWWVIMIVVTMIMLKSPEEGGAAASQS